MQPADTTASTVRNRHRLRALIVAGVAATAILVPTVPERRPQMCAPELSAIPSHSSTISLSSRSIRTSYRTHSSGASTSAKRMMSRSWVIGIVMVSRRRVSTAHDSVSLPPEQQPQGVADLSFVFGNPGDIPLAGDFDGNRCDTPRFYRRSRPGSMSAHPGVRSPRRHLPSASTVTYRSLAISTAMALTLLASTETKRVRRSK